MLSTQHGKKKRIMGIWDSTTQPISLGGLLILIEELQILRTIHGVDFADIGVICEETYLRSINLEQAKKNLVTLVNNNIQDDRLLIFVLKNIKGVDACYLTNTVEKLKKFINLHSYLTWPMISEKGIVSHRYESTLFVQQYYREEGSIPYLYCKDDSVEWARNFITRYCLPRMPIVVHLKNSPNQQHCSNADLGAWLDFLNNSHKSYDTVFILIGNEEATQRMRNLPNVLISKDFNSNLSRDLALIQMSFMFMGTASGPSTMAVFSDTPYAIYKDPDHHAEEMKDELGDSNHFAFAKPLQRILRVFQTRESLMTEFDYFYSHINRGAWEERFAGTGSAVTIRKSNALKERSHI